MSISPTDAQQPAPPSSRAPRQNPSSGHEPRRHHLDRRIPAPSAGELVAGSGPTVAIYEDSYDLSKNSQVIEPRLPDTRKYSSGQNSGTMSQCQTTGQGASASQVRFDQFGFAQIGQKPSGTANFMYSDRMASGSIGFQGNAVRSASRRNQVVSANHLLNFHYDPISRPQSRVPPPRRQQKIKPYNKDLFLQANFKFVVLDTGSYQLESVDPDKMLQWEDVVCVKYSTPFPVQCPICLESPLCPQITSCGHIYCFPCILQYLFMGEEDHKGEYWKKCPLCFMMISSKDLYTIQINNVQQYHVGEHAYFTLLTRPKDSIAPSVKNKQGHIVSYNNNGICDIFSKFVLTSNVELSVRESKSDLNNWLCKAESGLVDDLEKLPYVSAAMEQLEERMKNWMEHRVFDGHHLRNISTLPDSLKGLRTLNKMPTSVTLNSESIYSDYWEPADGALCGSSELEITDSSGKMGADYSLLRPDDLPASNESPEKGRTSYVEVNGVQSNLSKDVKERDSYTFYQAIDGQHLILHPLNMKCLLHHYGSYDLLPQRINGKILELETVTQSEAMRRRYRFLSHFSLTTTFQLCEISLGEILPTSSLAPFMDEIRKREKQRKRLAKKEEDDRAQAEAAGLPDWPVPPEQNHLSHRDATFSLDDFTALGRNGAPSTSPPITSERKLFSSVTRLGFAAAHDSPSLKSEESADSSQQVEKICEASSTQGPGPMPTLSFANIIATPRTVENQETQKANGFGKKGKKATKVLLSTSGGRRY